MTYPFVAEPRISQDFFLNALITQVEHASSFGGEGYLLFYKFYTTDKTPTDIETDLEAVFQGTKELDILETQLKTKGFYFILSNQGVSDSDWRKKILATEPLKINFEEYFVELPDKDQFNMARTIERNHTYASFLDVQSIDEDLQHIMDTKPNEVILAIFACAYRRETTQIYRDIVSKPLILHTDIRKKIDSIDNGDLDD